MTILLVSVLIITFIIVYCAIGIFAASIYASRMRSDGFTENHVDGQIGSMVLAWPAFVVSSFLQSLYGFPGAAKSAYAKLQKFFAFLALRMEKSLFSR